jgi:HSF-type DNA-binding
MKVLSTKEFNEIIAWMPSGESFSIVKPKTFVADILPDHFKSAKYSSFTRKLHRWGFMRHYRGEEAGAFYHKDFKRDRLDLVEQMTCHKLDGPKAPAAVSAVAALKKSKVVKETAERAVLRVTAVPAAPKATTAQRMVAIARPVPLPQQLPIPQPANITAQLQRQLQNINAVQEIPQMDAAERLHAAIELEVNRRLKERIQVAALSRHALAMMQQQQRQLNAAAPTLRDPRTLGLNLVGGHHPSSLQAQLLQMQQRKHQFGMDASCLAFANMPRRDMQGLDNLPPSNVQGAKTA